MFFNIPKIGLSEVLSNWLGWFTVSQSRTTSWRVLANSKILSISFWTSAKLALREFERSRSARLDGLFRTFFLAWKIKNHEHHCLSKSYSCPPYRIFDMVAKTYMLSCLNIKKGKLLWWRKLKSQIKDSLGLVLNLGQIGTQRVWTLV